MKLGVPATRAACSKRRSDSTALCSWWLNGNEPYSTEVLVPLRIEQGSMLVARQRLFLVLSLTVVFGRLLTVDCFTKRPEIALRPRLPLLPFLGIVITSFT